VDQSSTSFLLAGDNQVLTSLRPNPMTHTCPALSLVPGQGKLIKAYWSVLMLFSYTWRNQAVYPVPQGGRRWGYNPRIRGL